MTLKTKKYVLFVMIFAAWLFMDMATKNWADQTLANRAHPIPVTVTEADNGKPLTDVLAAHLGWTPAQVQERADDFEKLEPAATYAATDKPYDGTGPAANARAFYVFWRGSVADPPRRIEKNERLLVSRWLTLALPGEDQAKIQKAAYDHLAAETFAEWLPRRFKKLDADDVPAIVAGLIHPVSGPTTRLAPGEAAVAGDTWLLTEHHVDVAGDWFKLVYAENPNAAFGFLKGVDPDLRYTLFTLLTLLAFVVILVIVYRLPAEGWFVYFAFAGILAGAAGNFIDRMRFHYVIDFLDADLGFMHWPTFNVADISIAAGVIALLLNISFDKNSPLVSKKDKEKRAEREARKAAA
ncbi:MAG: signal peptidase II [Deltaproteobacteria bacterium]|nr:MAG: signal peptidase II [Deltaproteobacteria bacterium]